MYENACRLMAKQTVALEVLSFHATAPVEEGERLAVSLISSSVFRPSGPGCSKLMTLLINVLLKF